MFCYFNFISKILTSNDIPIDLTVKNIFNDIPIDSSVNNPTEYFDQIKSCDKNHCVEHHAKIDSNMDNLAKEFCEFLTRSSKSIADFKIDENLLSEYLEEEENAPINIYLSLIENNEKSTD